VKLLKCYAPWCQPCKGLTMVIEGAKDKISVPIQDINIDEDADTAVKYGIRSVPALILVEDDGTEIKRNVGLLNEAQLLDFIG
jgi:thioredoxin-like negative regulator of GroEL